MFRGFHIYHGSFAVVTPSLQLRVGQSPVMTGQLQQSIKLLQFSALELAEFIEQELEKNPLLTLEEPVSSEAKDEEGRAAEEAPERMREGGGDDMYTRSLDMSGAGNGGEGAAPDATNDDIWGGETEGQRYGDGGFSGGGEGDGASAGDVIEQSYAEPLGLKDHLREQVQVDFADSQQKIIAAHLIDALDESGYLREDISHLSALLGCDAAQVETVLERLRGCEPAGVFARDLRDCLWLQLRDRGTLTRAMESLLEHLEQVADAPPRKLARLCRVEEEEIAAMLAEIRSLNPRPGGHFSAEQVQTLIPDILVRKQGKDGWRVELNADVLPKLLVNRQYHTQLAGRTRRREEKKFLNEHLANATWLVKALDQRAQTLLKVGTEIVRQQEMFLEHGIRHLKPLTLRHIAEAVGVHESTVSRVTSSKHMATPRGVFPLKYFFSSALADAGEGEGTSSRTVMHLIREMVAAEVPAAVLADDDIARILAERGIEVARRTVVKYRKILHIPSSVERRRAIRRAG